LTLELTPEHIKPLEKSHDRTSFDCGHEDLNHYLRTQARQDAEKRVAATFVLTRPGTPAVLGFYSLSASISPVGELPPDLMKRLPRYGQLPVTLLGRLAVDRSVGGKGVGEVAGRGGVRLVVHGRVLLRYAVLRYYFMRS
jgi:hypothetical protein